ncbi:MAG: hypothetical protein MN733_42145 [Nitrososphaera sp.]|nr:hypothetical protein [Nitrososphaera sp.]
MDSLVAATCKVADIVISVAEDDEVGRQTNSNLTQFLQAKRKAKIVYTMLNKGRNIKGYPDIEARVRQRPQFAMLGVIPFDLDILEEFGSERFWTTVFETLYFRSIIDAWNELSKAEHVRELSVSKYRFPPKIFMRPSEGRFTLFERMLRLYSIVFICGGVVMWAWSEFRFGDFEDPKFVAVLSILFGVFALVFSTSAIQSYIRGRQRTRDERERH